MDGYIQKQYDMPVKRYVQQLDLHADDESIQLYRKLHSEQCHWKEIRDGIRAVGILEMEIYISGNRLVMVVDAPEQFDWQSAMERLATLPRQAEWEALVGRFQRCGQAVTSNEKWNMMERMFHLYD